MIVLSHRGYWKRPDEKNAEIAFRRSFELGFGTETDIRDCAGRLVISHDPPRGGEMPLERLLEIHREHDASLPLALNIKADGLQPLLKGALERYEVANYFVFDMSLPDALGYVKHGLRVFSRQSELEPHCCLYDSAAGVWLDMFSNDWIGEQVLGQHLEAGKEACVVSPELHGRPYEGLWRRLAQMPAALTDKLMLCTDYPETARDVFGFSVAAKPPTAS